MLDGSLGGKAACHDESNCGALNDLPNWSKSVFNFPQMSWRITTSDGTALDRMNICKAWLGPDDGFGPRYEEP